MDEPGVYLEKLSYFSRLLAKQGLGVSPRETADAAQILISLGLEDRQTVKTALRMVYAKSREEQLVFDRVFDGFFLSEEAIKQQREQRRQQQEEFEKARQEVQQEFGEQSVALDESQLDTYASMPAESRQKLRDFVQRFKGNMERNPNLYGNFIHSVFAKALLEQQMRMEDAAVGAEAADPELGMLFRDITQFKDTEIPKAIAVIQTISRQISGELTAKRNKTGHSGKLDFRRTIRKGLETGGSFYRLRYRKNRSRKKHLVLLCDVSGSMMQFSEFALRFIQSLNQVSESSRVFLFSEGITEADAFSLQNMDKFRDYVRDSGIYGKGTDLGAALAKLNSMEPAVLNQATTLLILSDAKTIDQTRAVAALQQSRAKAGKMLWLNPIPEGKWQYLRSVQTFASVCTMVSCSTLRALANACRRLAI